MRALRLPLLLGLAILILDQASKLALLFGLGLKEMEGQPGFVLAPFLTVAMVWNRGVSFGLLAHDSDAARWALIVLAILVCAAILYALRRTTRRLPLVAAGLIVGGAAGNVIDRLIYGQVADFIVVHWREWYFPAFNLADSAITIGAAFLVADELFLHHRGPAAAKAE